ncbi:MAG: 4Fe-4S dicluster domain-containing protein [Planctomycetes bacterium]|nr:4Fe-4S dicluster domain-containing protein [Planctomycetota bacterium]
MSSSGKVRLARGAFDALFDALHDDGRVVVGPTLKDGAIAYERLASAADLPAGWTDVQEAGRYRLERRGDEALFGYAVGPHAWKRFLHPPEVRLLRATRTDEGFEVDDAPPAAERLAFLGVRACDLAAIAIQDRVLLGGPYPDPIYRARREAALLVAVQCGTAGGTCFCVSMNTGPAVTGGADLTLTELLAPEHAFVVEASSPAGEAVLARLEARLGGALPAATEADRQAVDEVVARTAAQMGRTLEAPGRVPQALRETLEHPRWDDVAARCLTCANCTMVCPTCFCTQVTDTTDLTGDHAERWRRWDSCFTLEFTYLHGQSVRASARSRYRQWLTHKLSTWHDQFGTSGCVGCGRCITWCPVGIDITEEVRALLAPAAGGGGA